MGDSKIVVFVIVGILILGTLGSSQEVFADSISTCQDISSANTSFVLTADVATSGTCFSILNVDNVSLDCSGHIITGDGTGTGIDVFNSDNSDVKNCTFTNFSTGISIQSSNHNLIEGNTLNQNNVGFFGEFSNNNSLNGNTANGNNNSGIGISFSTNNSLNENIANENGNFGIFLGSSNFSTFNDNTTNGNSVGIYLAGSFDNTLNRNTANGNTFSGIGLDISGSISLNDNIANGNGGNGITIQSSPDNILNGNTTNENDLDGVFVESFFPPGLIQNTIENGEAKSNTGFGFNDRTAGPGTEGTSGLYSNNTCPLNGSGGSDPSGLCDDTPPVVVVVVDIKPGSDPNAIQPFQMGVTPVVILSSSTFSAETVDFSTVTFGPNDVVPVHNKPHFKDVNNDGLDDMVLHFKTKEIGIEQDTVELCLMAKTLDGTSIEGCDTIMVVPKV